MTDPQVGVVLVTHNSDRWIAETLDSIAQQSLQPDRVVIIDDASTDATLSIVQRWAIATRNRNVRVLVTHATSQDSDAATRIARNFCQGVRLLDDVELIALADHDDVWLTERLIQQVTVMNADPSTVMVAGNGIIVDDPRTLFDAFDIPEHLESEEAVPLLRHVIRHSVATGGASMVRRSALMRGGVLLPPAGWLHDRWWSLIAASRGGLRLARDPVIRYRLSPTQTVGLSRGRQTGTGATRLRTASPRDLQRISALHGLRKTAAPDLQPELQWGRLVRNLL